MFTVPDDSPSLLVTLIVTALPAVTLPCTADGTATVAAASLLGVTVTFAFILSEDWTKLTTKLADKNPVPVKVKLLVKPSKIFPDTEERVGLTGRSVNSSCPVAVAPDQDILFTCKNLPAAI